MSIRFLLFLTGWFALIAGLFVVALNSTTVTLVFPGLVGWSLFVVFCAFGLTKCIVSTQNSAFWTGVTVFGTVSTISIAFADTLYNPTLGIFLSDFAGFDVNDPTESLRQDQFRNLADLVVATLMAVAGGLLGNLAGGQKTNRREKDANGTGPVSTNDQQKRE